MLYRPGASWTPFRSTRERSACFPRERPALGVSIPVPLASLNCCFGCLLTHAKCFGRLWLLSATLRPQEKREHKDGERDQSRKQIHILIGQGLCLPGDGNTDWTM